MSAISQKSISGITSITTPAGVDNVFTVHTNDTTERFRVDSNGNQSIVGILTVSNHVYVTGGDLVLNDTISHFGDGNTKIRFPATDTFTVETAGSERLRIDSAGRVIIANGGNGGTADVNADNFVVKNTASNTSCGISILNADNQNSTLYFGNTSDSKHAEIVWSDASNLFLIGTSNAGASIKFRTANQSDAVLINSSGNVGIGTDNPTKKLEVYVGSSSIKVEGNDDGSFHIDPNSTGGTQETLIGQANGDLRLLSGAGSYQANRANILLKNSNKHIIMNADAPTGNVGIGTDNPSTRLNVTAGGVNNAVFLKTTSDKALIEFENSAGAVYNTRIGSATIGAGNVGLLFETGIASNRLQAMVIDRYGKVGINETDPYYILDIKITDNTTALSGGGGGDWGGNGIRLSNTSTTVGAMSLAHFRVHDADWHIGNKYVSANKSDFIFLHEGTSERLRITTDGDVLIGKTSGDHILDINASSDEIRLSKASLSDYTGIQLDRDASGTAGGYFGLAGATNHYITGAAQHDICIRSESNLIFSAGGPSGWFRIDSSGAAILKNTTAALPRSDFMGSLKPLSQIASTWNAYHSLTRHDASSSYGPYLMLAKNRNDAYNSNGTVQDNDECGNIAFLGNDGTAFREAARIRGEVDGTPGSSQVPGAITFATNGGSGVVERLRITSNGELQLNGDTKKFVLPMYKGTFYCDANSYTKFATVTGNQLSSEIELTCHTTINAVVISSSFIIKAGHHQDFWIESRELKYTSFTIKCISNNNQNFDIYAKRNGGSYQSTQSNISFVIIPKNDETVTINNTVNYTGQSIVHSTQTGALKITGTGGVNCDINVAGSITGSSKNFSIEHPLTSLASTKKLVHASIEGPQCDLIYRGKIDLVGGTATVNIDIATGMSDGTFVKLNRDVQCFTSNETGWGAVKGSVSGNILTITAQDNSSTDTISWMVVGERQDDTIKSSSVTDDSGKLIVEPLTNEEPDNSHLHEFYPTS